MHLYDTLGETLPEAIPNLSKEPLESFPRPAFPGGPPPSEVHTVFQSICETACEETKNIELLPVKLSKVRDDSDQPNVEPEEGGGQVLASLVNGTELQADEAQPAAMPDGASRQIVADAVDANSQAPANGARNGRMQSMRTHSMWTRSSTKRKSEDHDARKQERRRRTDEH